MQSLDPGGSDTTMSTVKGLAPKILHAYDIVMLVASFRILNLDVPSVI